MSKLLDFEDLFSRAELDSIIAWANRELAAPKGKTMEMKNPNRKNSFASIVRYLRADPSKFERVKTIADETEAAKHLKRLRADEREPSKYAYRCAA